MRIEIGDDEFVRLQKLAEPLVDTPGTVVARLLDFYEKQVAAGVKENALDHAGPVFGINVPSLTHTKLLWAEFDGRKPDRTTWDALLRLALEGAALRARGFDELRRISGANIVQGTKTDQGYKPMPQLGLSYQGVSAEDAVRVITRIAGHLGVDCQFEFEWRRKNGAFRPGERALGNISGNFLTVSQGRGARHEELKR